MDGGTPNAGSCDGLFLLQPPPQPVSYDCGYTTIFYAGEGGIPSQERFPLPWNSVYTAAWKQFLIALNKHIQQKPWSAAFVSIDVAGPTSNSTEMILPGINAISPFPPTAICGQAAGVPGSSNNGMLTLTQGPYACNPSAASVSGDAAWNLLFENNYGWDSNYPNSDLAFIQAWDSAIDTFGEIFSGVTLVLETTPDALLYFPGAGADLTTPAQGFGEDCSGAWNAANMACAAVTQILGYFVNPTAGGNNGKETQECELNASEPWTDLGIQGVKWLARSTAGGTLSLPGTSSSVSQVTAGLQFSTVFAGANQWEGCPIIPTTANPTPCPGLTPEQALYNVLAHYFDGTSFGTAYVKNRPLSGFDTVNDVGNFNYSKARMNVLQMWDWDVLYTDGLSTCSMLQITGNPDASPSVLPDTTSCQAIPPTVDNNGNTALQILSRANRQILRLAEEAPQPPAPPSPPPPPVKCTNGGPCQQ